MLRNSEKKGMMNGNEAKQNNQKEKEDFAQRDETSSKLSLREAEMAEGGRNEMREGW